MLSSASSKRWLLSTCEFSKITSRNDTGTNITLTVLYMMQTHTLVMWQKCIDTRRVGLSWLRYMWEVLRPLRYLECGSGQVPDIYKTLHDQEDASNNVHGKHTMITETSKE
jgi:hypothetical protein